jgi:hypothetical protein
LGSSKVKFTARGQKSGSGQVFMSQTTSNPAIIYYVVATYPRVRILCMHTINYGVKNHCAGVHTFLFPNRALFACCLGKGRLGSLFVCGDKRRLRFCIFFLQNSMWNFGRLFSNFSFLQKL